MSPLIRAEAAVRPNIVAFMAILLLIAGIASVVDPPGTGEQAVAITIDEVAPGSAGEQTGPASGGASTGGATADAAAAAGGQATADGSGSAGGAVADAELVGSGASTAGTATSGEAGTTGGSSSGGTAPGGASSGTGTTSGSSGTAGSSSGTAGGTGAGTTTGPQQDNTPTYPEAPLYDDTEKFRGITDDTIEMCGHAALVAAAAFNTSEDDFNVYWTMVNDNGGIYGRQVEFTWEDDKYLSSEAITAAESCAGKDPFLILGGIGFDQIPGVREWAESNEELYVHHIAVAPTRNYNYSFTMQPTVEKVGREFGLMIAEHYADRTLGIMWRDSDNWRPGRDAGVEVLNERGVEIASDQPVIQNQGVYSQQINDMMLNGVDTVWLWENALNAGAIINQASEQGYKPTWIVFPFNTTLDLLNDKDVDIIGGATWPAYRVGGYGDDWSQYGLDREIAAFENAYATYRPGVATNDLLFQAWLGFKVFHQMLVDCGPDCNRNSFAGMMLSGYTATVEPICTFSFGGPNSFGNHHATGGYWEQFADTSVSPLTFKSTRYCVPTLG